MIFDFFLESPLLEFVWVGLYIGLSQDQDFCLRIYQYHVNRLNFFLCQNDLDHSCYVFLFDMNLHFFLYDDAFSYLFCEIYEHFWVIQSLP